MKTIGLLGGMSWESTATYYTLINQGVRKQLGGLHSAEIILYSVEFSAIEQLQEQGRWDDAAVLLATAAKKIETAGAEFILICTNTMHKVAPVLQQKLTIPLLHIADATATAVKQQEIRTVGLLGTRFTMKDDFYKGRLQGQHDITVLVPKEKDRALIHRVIFEELCCGTTSTQSRKEFIRIINDLVADGAQAVILGCTEIALLVNQTHTAVPLFDTTEIHASSAVQFALAQGTVTISDLFSA